MKCLIKFLFLLLLLSGLSFRTPAESYYPISETELQQIESTSKEQRAQLEKLETELKAISKLLEKSEKENRLKSKFIYISFALGIVTGGAAVYALTK